MRESCKQAESWWNWHSRHVSGDTKTHWLCFLNNARQSHVFTLLEHRLTHTQTHTHWSPSPFLSLSLIFIPRPLRVCSTSAAAGERSVAFQRRPEQAAWPRLGQAPKRENPPCFPLSIFLFSASPSLISRPTSGATAKLLLSCHSGTDDKIGIFTWRRDPGYGTHTYGRQEWKEGISSSSPPTLFPSQAAAAAGAASNRETEESWSEERLVITVTDSFQAFVGFFLSFGHHPFCQLF